jgi:radical SAM protein with 4Fe4S-binding SPASM domain
MPFEGFPLIIGWELTLTCNLRCAHCGSSAGRPRCNELTTAEALALCEELPALLVQEVDFTGGEPLLRPDWPVIAGRLIELGIPTNVLTNGMAVDAGMVARMQDVGISGVGISLDGLEPTHDAVRCRNGSYAAVVDAIAAMQAAALPFNVITTVHALNVGELPEMLALMRSLGVRYWRLQPLIATGRVRSHAELHIGRSTLFRAGQFITEAKRSGACGDVQIICSDGLEYVEGDDCERPWRGCSAGIVSCGITSDGKVKGCLSMPDDIIDGDLRQETLWNIWFDPNAFAYTRGFAASQLGDNCSACEMRMECKGGCSSSSYCETGQFHNEALCYYKSALEYGGAVTPAPTPAHR